ncbi:uncharacterized protein V6R79_002814 [Siganus canaliculatus]
MRTLRPDWTASSANQRAHTWEEFKKDSEKCRKVVLKAVSSRSSSSSSRSEPSRTEPSQHTTRTRQQIRKAQGFFKLLLLIYSAPHRDLSARFALPRIDSCNLLLSIFKSPPLLHCK